MKRFTARIAIPKFNALMKHLFPGDHDEHGAVLTCGISQTGSAIKLLVRDVIIAKEGIDYVPGVHGYRALTANFVARAAKLCAKESLGYLAVHCHGGDDAVSFSQTDLESHRRGYPAILDITAGGPVGALVFARNAVAGEIWTPNGVFPLQELEVVGGPRRRLFPVRQSRGVSANLERYNRQSLLFGNIGQLQLKNAKIGIIGLGGAGSLLSEWLAHLGVGEIVAVDFDKVETTNRPRLVGATAWDAQDWLSGCSWQWLSRLGRYLATYKVNVAKRLARRANKGCKFRAIVGDVADLEVAAQLKDADYLFLCADSAQSRLVFNALVHQYLIPGVQVGSKVPINLENGEVGDVFSVSRPVVPFTGGGCLLCNGLIPPTSLQEEALSEDERRRNRYVDDDGVKVPSVITLNAQACAQAANDFLFSFLGLQHEDVSPEYLMHFGRRRKWTTVQCTSDVACFHCGLMAMSSYGRGDRADLPCRSRKAS